MNAGLSPDSGAPDFTERAGADAADESAMGSAGPRPGTVKPGTFSSKISRFLLRRLLEKIIRTGALQVAMPDGQVIAAGTGDPSVVVHVLAPATVWRILRDPDLALGEAFTEGTLVINHGTIFDLLELVMKNLRQSRGSGVMQANARMRHLLRRLIQHNPVARAKANVEHHYDLSDELYEMFLDAGRQYSCAYYLSPADTLEQAQDQKKRHIAAKLLLRPGHRVLDIGSGWGGLAQHLAQTSDVRVCGLTLSTQQLGHAIRTTAEAGLSDRVQFHLRDYRHETGQYDRIVSVGMFEHVGIGHYREYFQKVAGLLAEDGVALIHSIGTARGPTTTSPWLNRYIFPGSSAPALSEILPEIERAGLYVTDVEVLRLHYAYTLRAWRERFMANRNRAAELYDERFCRMWEYYLSYCEASFRESWLVVFQLQLSKRVDAVPLTRDYIAAAERAQVGDAADEPPDSSELQSFRASSVPHG